MWHWLWRRSNFKSLNTIACVRSSFLSIRPFHESLQRQQTEWHLHEFLISKWNFSNCVSGYFGITQKNAPEKKRVIIWPETFVIAGSISSQTSCPQSTCWRLHRNCHTYIVCRAHKVPMYCKLFFCFHLIALFPYTHPHRGPAPALAVGQLLPFAIIESCWMSLASRHANF